MNLLRLSLAYLRRRPWGTLLNVTLLALGVATIVVLLLFGRQVERALGQNAAGVDLVVGAKGSPLQLVLSALYQADAPTGNIAVADAQQVMQNPAVKRAIPLAMGDSYRGFRVVGTELAYVERFATAPAAGRLWEGEGEGVLGAAVAAATGLGVDSVLVSAHGLSAEGDAHAEHPLRVVGVLEATGAVVDRLVLTAVETVWAVHEEEAAAAGPPRPSLPGPLAGLFGGQGQPEREYTALLVEYATPLAAVSLPRQINTQTNLMAASPALETQRLLSLLGFGIEALRAFGLVLVAAAALGVGIALYNALRERHYDLAVMRALGMPRRKLLAHVLIEGLLLAALGLALGLALGHLAAELLGAALSTPRTQLPLTGADWAPAEWALVALVLAVGAAAALLPAVQAYRTDPARTLARG